MSCGDGAFNGHLSKKARGARPYIGNLFDVMSILQVVNDSIKGQTIQSYLKIDSQLHHLRS
jgi:hypothetical protein